MSEEITTTEIDELPEDVKTLFANIKKKRKARYRDVLLVLTLSIGFLLLLIQLFLEAPPSATSSLMTVLLPAILEVYLLLCLVSREGKGIYGFDEREMERIALTDDKRVIGAVLDLSGHTPSRSYSPQRIALMQNLLSRLTPEDAHLLSRKQKIILVNSIRPNGKGITFVALKALHQFGDLSTLGALKRWKFNQLALPLNPKVRIGLDDCIAAIEARLATNQSDSQLLRPAAPTDKADTYLRPVTHKPDENAETLLRAEVGEKRK